MEYYDNMLGLHLKVNSGQKVVGYYSTGSKIDYISSLMHNGFARQVSDPVLVTIDVELKDFQMAVKGYTGSPVADNVLCKFLPVDLQLTSYDAEKIGVDALINGNPEDTYLDAPASILSDIDNLEMSLGQLLQNIETVSDYVQDVVEKKVEGDAEVGLKLAEALSAIPSVDRDVFNKAFNGSVQDLLVVQYLVQLTGAQITLADKIQGLL